MIINFNLISIVKEQWSLCCGAQKLSLLSSKEAEIRDIQVIQHVHECPIHGVLVHLRMIVCPRKGRVCVCGVVRLGLTSSFFFFCQNPLLIGKLRRHLLDLLVAARYLHRRHFHVLRCVGEVETRSLPTQAIESSIKGPCCLLLRLIRPQPYSLTAIRKPNFRHPFPPFSLPHSFVHLTPARIVGGERVIARSSRRRRRRRRRRKRINGGHGRFHHV